jgi:hypothetical protein
MMLGSGAGPYDIRFGRALRQCEIVTNDKRETGKVRRGAGSV